MISLYRIGVTMRRKTKYVLKQVQFCDHFLSKDDTCNLGQVALL